MPNREDETWLNMNPHPETCSCPECIRKKKRIKYPYPAEFECPACGNISIWYSDQKAMYKCLHGGCEVEGKTLQEITDRKAQKDKQLRNLWSQLNGPLT